MQETQQNYVLNLMELSPRHKHPFNLHLCFNGEIQRSWFGVHTFAGLIHFLLKRGISLNNTGWDIKSDFNG